MTERRVLARALRIAADCIRCARKCETERPHFASALYATAWRMFELRGES